MFNIFYRCVFACFFSLIATTIYADYADDNCIIEKFKTSVSTTTVGEVLAACAGEFPEKTPVTSPDGEKISTAKERLLRERDTQWSPYILTAHKQNYVLLYTHVSEQNPFYEDSDDGLPENKEAKFQLSIKIPLIENGLLFEGDSLHFGLTVKSFLQVYSQEESAPLRETNYAPEIFYTLPFDYKYNDADTAFRLGIEHESNGKTKLFSRGWNRIYAQMFYARNNYLISFRPWYRIPENEKDSTEDFSGDDNPDIEKYMGNFELTGVMTYKDLEFSTLIRNNLRGDNYGAIEMGVSFPIFGRVRGYAQYFNGYGESLIDYNHHVERIGIGFLITDLM